MKKSKGPHAFEHTLELNGKTHRVSYRTDKSAVRVSFDNGDEMYYPLLSNEHIRTEDDFSIWIQQYKAGDKTDGTLFKADKQNRSNVGLTRAVNEMLEEEFANIVVRMRTFNKSHAFDLITASNRFEDFLHRNRLPYKKEVHGFESGYLAYFELMID